MQPSCGRNLSFMGGNGNMAQGERGRWEINLPEANVGYRQPLYSSVAMVIAGMMFGSKSAPDLHGAAFPKHMPLVTGVGRHQHGAPFFSLNTRDILQFPCQLWVISVAFLSAARGRKLLTRMRHRRTIPTGGMSTPGLFA